MTEKKNSKGFVKNRQCFFRTDLFVWKKRTRWGSSGLFRSLPLLLQTFILTSYVSAQLPVGTQASGSFKAVQLKVQQRLSSDQIFVDLKCPELSWQVQGDLSLPQTQISAYQVVVGSREALEKLGNGTGTARSASPGVCWNTGRRSHQLGEPFRVTYTGEPLVSDRTYFWFVRLWDGDGHVSNWSRIDSFQVALLSRPDWAGAKWIARTQMAAKDRVLPGDEPVKIKTADGLEKKRPFGTDNDTLPLLRKEFGLSAPLSQIKKATLYISGLGQFEARINGHKIGDHFLDPGWTNYKKEALYVSFDVTDKLQNGTNAIGVILGNGFYYIPGDSKWYKKLLVQYGYPKMICRLSIQYSSGKMQNIISDNSWKTARSSITFSSIYGGELEDGRLRQPGWSKPGFDEQAHGWTPAVFVNDTPASVHLQRTDPVKVMDSFETKKIYTATDNGQPAGFTYDLGQNCSGIPSIRVNGKKGDTVTLIPAELMTPDHRGNQKATGKYRLIYILERDGLQDWHPVFTYYGFRYVQVLGAIPKGHPNLKGLPVVEEIKTLHLRNSAPAAGSFSCSNELFNKTSELIGWAMKSNMMSVLTDCPTREKLGWLEQVHLMGSSLRYNWQVRHLLKKSLQDMRNAQTPEGLIPEIAPEYTVFTWGGNMFRDSPEWGSSSIIIPWYLYEWYGDSSELRKSYSMMQRYSDYLRGKAKGHILYQGLGDWFDLGPNPPGTSQLTPKGLTATAIYYYDLQILEKTARLLGKVTDADRFRQQAADVRFAFNSKFLHIETDKKDSVHHQAYYGTGSQTADAMALYMDLVPDSVRAAVVAHLVRGIEKNNYALTAGDIGYRYLLRVLEQEGRSDIIFKMNNRSDVPGYGYQLAEGATALTESWQALPSVSNNHFMLGHLMEWFYAGILGIRLNMAGADPEKQAPLVIEPQMVGDLTWAKGGYETPYGPVRVGWQKKPAEILLNIHIPVGLKAIVKLPFDKDAGAVLHTEGVAQGTTEYKYKKMLISLPAGSGDHQYRISFKPKQ